MEISSYNTSNIQPYGSQNGIKFASDNEAAAPAVTTTDKSISNSEQVNRAEIAKQKLADKSADSVDAAVKAAEQREKISQEQREKMMEQMKDFVSSINKGLSFRVDQETGRDIVTIYEAATGDVIRQIPEEEMLEVLRRLAQDRERHSGLVMTKV